ncbi:MAG: valine--tRNA ligase [Rhodospirillaceae bacterium]|nr:valine--tRNA ligase [Rhodospirillaceae bacterium]
MTTLEKTYAPAEIETRLYELWEDAGAFACGRTRNATYTIVIPPPNVTGSLHMGHALNNTLQDLLVRWRRMQGYDTLWQPGTDHAGIATQMVVERQLAEDGIRLDRGRALNNTGEKLISREDFLDKVWAWKEESGGTIINQLKRLGASCDWSRERFTMDDGLSKAVLKVFVELHRQGLIFKDKRLVNWDPKLHTAISDLEVVQKEVESHLWYFRYPIEDEPDRYVTVATTRPETMLGDTGVAVHPDDERYRDIVGKNAILPITGRRIRIVADSYADPEQGSGAVKITPAHDFNDFDVGRRAGLDMINVFDASAVVAIDTDEFRTNADVSEWGDPDAAIAGYHGLDRFVAREKIVAEMESRGLLAKIEANRHMVPFGDRSDVVIEPWLTDQWYVDAETLAKPAVAAVEKGDTRFVPENWSKTYFEWLRNIQPWCISRQLWWGHQIPAWYGPDGEVFVAESETAAAEAAEAQYGKPVELTRDPDVLDTWFSSALWPFSTLGWPNETPELARYYPTSVLITGFDIIFFWVARMMMMGLYFMDEIPFHGVYIHALVRDEKGAKMSKSKGNVIDPLEVIDEFGADALRFTLTAMAAMGRDIKLATSRVQGYRNFGTKLWNAARFCQMNECAVPDPDFDPASVELALNKWITGGVTEATAAVTKALEEYKFDQAAGLVYQFTWHTFCDWYVEFAKPVLQGDDAAAKAETRAVAGWTLQQILRLLHPFMPFITEELWQHFGDGEGMLIHAAWPANDIAPVDDVAKAQLDWAVRVITEVRTVRNELNVPASAKIHGILRGASDETKEHLARYSDQILRLARLDAVDLDADLPDGAVQIVLGEAILALPLADVIDLGQERDRLAKEIARLEKDMAGIDKKLANEKFLTNAPEEVIAEQHERRADASHAKEKLEAALKRLKVA